MIFSARQLSVTSVQGGGDINRHFICLAFFQILITHMEQFRAYSQSFSYTTINRLMSISFGCQIVSSIRAYYGTTMQDV